jgi:hypothetical protein
MYRGSILHNYLFLGLLYLVSVQAEKYPPLYPCHDISDISLISTGVWSEEWMKLDVETVKDITWPTGHYPTNEHVVYDQPIFAGVGPSKGVQTLVVSSKAIRVGVYNSEDNWVGEVEKTLSELLQTNNMMRITSAGFLPIHGDQYVWFTVDIPVYLQREFLYIVYLPRVSTNSLAGFNTPVRVISGDISVYGVYGCSFSDRIVMPAEKISMACMIKQVFNIGGDIVHRTNILKRSISVKFTSGLADGWDIENQEDFTFDILLGDALQTFPIHLSTVNGLSTTGSIYYRCSPTVYDTDRVWCRRKYIDNIIREEKTFLTSAVVNPNYAGRFFGGITENDMVVYFLDRIKQVIRVFHTTEDVDSSANPSISHLLPHTSGEYYFGGFATTNNVPTTEEYHFQLSVSTSTTSRVEFYYATKCQACSSCPLGQYAKQFCDTLHNYDTGGCTECATCIISQFMESTSCVDGLDTVYSLACAISPNMS